MVLPALFEHPAMPQPRAPLMLLGRRDAACSVCPIRARTQSSVSVTTSQHTNTPSLETDI